MFFVVVAVVVVVVVVFFCYMPLLCGLYINTD